MFKAKITKLIKELSECSEGQFEILKRIDGLYYFMKCRSYSKCCLKYQQWKRDYFIMKEEEDLGSYLKGKSETHKIYR